MEGRALRTLFTASCSFRKVRSLSLQNILFSGFVVALPVRTILSVEATGQAYVRGDVNHNADLSIEVNRRLRKRSFRKYTHELYDRPGAPFKLQIWMLKAEVLDTMLYGCVVSGACVRATTTSCAEPTTAS